MIEKQDDDFLGVNIKGMMMTLIARWNEQMDSKREETEFADIRPSDIRVFGQLRGRTVKLSVIHKEMGFSRQAAQQAVERLVERDLLKVEMVDGNKRDKMVSITEKGQELRTLAAQQIREIENSCAEIIGEDGKETLRTLLSQLLKANDK